MAVTTREGFALLDALHDAPTGYYDGMADPLYALESTGSTVVVFWAGPTTARQARLATRIAADNGEDWDRYAWNDLAHALDPLEDYVNRYVEATDAPNAPDEYDRAATAARKWLSTHGVYGTVTVARGVWSKGPRVVITNLH